MTNNIKICEIVVLKNLSKQIIHPLWFDEKKIFVIALSLKPWKKDNNNETINLGFIQ